MDSVKAWYLLCILKNLKKLVAVRYDLDLVVPYDLDDFIRFYAQIPTDNGKLEFLLDNDILIEIYFEKVGIHDARNLKERLEGSIDSCILVHFDSITTFASKFLSKLRVECFHSSEMVHDPTESVYASAHKHIGRVEDDLDNERLPKILPSDPICKFHGFAPGSVVEISRPMPNGGTWKVRRLVL